VSLVSLELVLVRCLRSNHLVLDRRQSQQSKWSDLELVGQ